MRCTSLALLSLSLATAACDPVIPITSDAGPGDASPPSDGGTDVVAVIPLSGTRDLDLLFVIDNSGSMAEEQASLAANTSRWVNVLENFPGGLPNIHVGVISPNLGTAPHDIAGCEGRGDDGLLQHAARGACTPPDGAFIRDYGNGLSGRDTNYDGTLTETFQCIARLGIDGCGFEQPLEAMRRALDGTHAENSGFLRADAHLAVVFLTDEDDCSVDDGAIFDTTVSDPLGPLSSFRCFEFGVVCDEDDPRAEGQKTNCRPREDSPYMPSVSRYVEFLRALKDDPAKITVAAISGGSHDSAVVGRNDADVPSLEPSCVAASGTAVPGIRLGALVAAFPGRSTQVSVCNENLSDPIAQVASVVSQQVHSLCLQAEVADIDPAMPGVQPSCQVVETIAGVETTVPACNDPADPEDSTNKTCYLIRPGGEACSGSGSGLSLSVYRDLAPSGDGEVSATCRLP